MSIRDRLTKGLSLVLSSIGQTFTRPYFWTHSDLGGYSTKSGVDLSHSKALSIVSYYSAVTLISQTIAQLPLILYRRMEPRGKERAFNHQLYSLLHDEPNEWMTARTFRETLQGHLLTWGNAFAEIDWDLSGEPVAQGLFPLRPDRMTLEWRKGRVVYNYQTPDGQQHELQAFQVLHIPGFGFDGILGYDPLTMHREALGLTKATEEFGARFFGAGSTMGGVLSRPVGAPKMSDGARQMLRESFSKMHSGLSNTHKVAILEEGTTYQSIGIPPENAQFLETRKFQRGEVASLFHVPPHMIGDLERATFSNIEHQGIEYVTYCLGPWLKAWESEIHRKLLAPTEKRTLFAEFLVDGLLRGDTTARYQAYSVGRQWGWLSANDVRERENMNPIEGGDTYMVPLNMMSASASLDVVAPDEKALVLKADTTAKRRAAVRRAAVAERHFAQFADVAQQLVTYESKAVRKAVKVHFNTKDAMTFDVWLSEFYDAELRAYIIKHMTPVMKALADSISELAFSEAGTKPSEDEAKLKAYVEDFARRYSEVHKGQALDALKADEPEVALTETLDVWSEVAAHKVAAAETVKLSNDVAGLIFAAAGYKVYTWYAIGAETCPICQEMDGVKVTTLRPPLHDGCCCQIGL
jgi:HK97 family phage portal protein